MNPRFQFRGPLLNHLSHPNMCRSSRMFLFSRDQGTSNQTNARRKLQQSHGGHLQRSKLKVQDSNPVPHRRHRSRACSVGICSRSSQKIKSGSEKMCVMCRIGYSSELSQKIFVLLSLISRDIIGLGTQVPCCLSKKNTWLGQVRVAKPVSGYIARQMKAVSQFK